MMSSVIGECDLDKKNIEFYSEVMRGLAKYPKQLPSKYFYDKTGDALFQAIMMSPDYYLTRCEMEIFAFHSDTMVNGLMSQGSDFELIELGPGDCAKSIHLLKAIAARKASFTYVPIDISENVIDQLHLSLPAKIPGLQIKGLAGDYFTMLAGHCLDNNKRKVVMCLGGNIGNMTVAESNWFCSRLRSYLLPGDQCIIGFDLLKHPAIIKRAYDDRDGLTRQFNLNLLHRINRELGGDFRVEQFEHYCTYDPLTGAAKSYLVCLSDMTVHFPDREIALHQHECIWTEISQKYSAPRIRQMAMNNGFNHNTELLDCKSWFMDAVWTAV
jgi:dimethylhistidine N-methyltransferase